MVGGLRTASIKKSSGDMMDDIAMSLGLQDTGSKLGTRKQFAQGLLKNVCETKDGGDRAKVP